MESNAASPACEMEIPRSVSAPGAAFVRSIRRSIQGRVDLPIPFSKQRISAHGGLERFARSLASGSIPPARLVRAGGRTRDKVGLPEDVERREGALRRRARSPEAIDVRGASRIVQNARLPRAAVARLGVNARHRRVAVVASRASRVERRGRTRDLGRVETVF